MRPKYFICLVTCLIRRYREAQARRGEEAEVDPEQFQDPDNEYGLFAGTTYEADDEEADRIYDLVDQNMDARRRARRCVRQPPHVSLLFDIHLTIGRPGRMKNSQNTARSDLRSSSSSLT